MKKEPRQRRDGTCALRVCRKPLPALARAQADPFHTSICCRLFHGVPFLSDEGAFKYQAQKRIVRKPNERQKAAMGKGLKVRRSGG